MGALGVLWASSPSFLPPSQPPNQPDFLELSLGALSFWAALMLATRSARRKAGILTISFGGSPEGFISFAILSSLLLLPHGSCSSLEIVFVVIHERLILWLLCHGEVFGLRNSRIVRRGFVAARRGRFVAIRGWCLICGRRGDES